MIERVWNGGKCSKNGTAGSFECGMARAQRPCGSGRAKPCQLPESVSSGTAYAAAQTRQQEAGAIVMAMHLALTRRSTAAFADSIRSFFPYSTAGNSPLSGRSSSATHLRMPRRAASVPDPAHSRRVNRRASGTLEFWFQLPKRCIQFNALALQIASPHLNIA